MPFIWESGAEYREGEEIIFEGQRYQVWQTHFSAPHLTPTQAPNLWRALGPSGTPFDSPAITAPLPDRGKHDKQGEEGYEKKDHKLLAAELFGAAAVVGGGIWAYSHHKNKENEKRKQEMWQQEMANNPDTYYQQVNQRTEAINNDRQYQGQRFEEVHWVGASGGSIPENAIAAGREANGEPLYIARVFYEGGVHPGKIGRHLRGAHIGYGGGEIEVDRYEVLVGDPNRIKWVEVYGRLQVQGWRPLEGGREQNGRFLFVALCEKDGGIHPGKVDDNDDHATIGYGGGEVWCNNFKVASYA